MIIQKTDPSHKGQDASFRIAKQEGYYVRYLLRSRELTFADVGRNLGINLETVLNVIYGRRRSRRVEAEIARILGHAEWNDVVMEARLATQGHGTPTKTQIQKAKAQAIKKRQELIARKRKALGLSPKKEAAA